MQDWLDRYDKFSGWAILGTVTDLQNENIPFKTLIAQFFLVKILKKWLKTDIWLLVGGSKNQKS